MRRIVLLLVSTIVAIFLVSTAVSERPTSAQTVDPAARLQGTITWSINHSVTNVVGNGYVGNGSSSATGKMYVSLKWGVAPWLDTIRPSWVDDGTSRIIDARTEAHDVATGFGELEGKTCTVDQSAWLTDTLYSEYVKIDMQVGEQELHLPPADGFYPQDFSATKAALVHSSIFLPIGPNATYMASGDLPGCIKTAAGVPIMGFLPDGKIEIPSAPLPTIDFALERHDVVPDSNGGSRTTDITITGKLSPNNKLATALFSAEPTTTDRQVRLDASGSTPPPGGTLTQYEWDFGDGTTLTTSSPTITHKFPEHDRDYSVTLTVVGDDGTRSDPYTLNVHSPKVIPTADFSFKVHSGGKVEFDASNSTPHSPSLPIKEYEWTFDDGSAVSKVATKTTEHSFDYFEFLKPVKKYMVSLVVTDSEGNRSDPVKHEIDVCSPDLPPSNGYEYGGLVRCVEAALPAQSPREILSTMRKIYYGGEQWSNVRNPNWDDIIPCGMSVPDPRSQLSPKLYSALIKASTENTVSNGDISHVFTGLEASACPSDSVAFPVVRDLRGVPGSTWVVKMPNYFIASWGGDVASAAGQKAADDALGGNNDWSNYIGPFGIRAGYDDLNGDVDGLVLGHSINGSSCSGSPPPISLLVPLSQSLRDYYPDPEKPLEVSAAYRNRIQCFKDILGVGTGDKKLDTMVYEFALPYYYRVAPRPIVAFKDATQTVKSYSSTATGLFADWLNSQR